MQIYPSENIEWRIVDFFRHNSTHGIKAVGLHSKLKIPYNQLNLVLNDLVRRGVIKRDDEYYRPDNLSAYHMYH